MLVKDAGDAFGRSRFVKIDCKGLDPGDYKKLGSKHKALHFIVDVCNLPRSIWIFRVEFVVCLARCDVSLSQLVYDYV